MSDINDPNYNADVVEYDPTAKMPESRGFTPIDDGTRKYKLTEGVKNVEIRTSQAGKPYINAHVLGEVVGGVLAGRKVSFWLNAFGRTDVDGKKLPSDLHFIAMWAGLETPARMSQQELVDLVKAALAKEPVVPIYTRWQVVVKDAVGKRKTIVKGQKNFPLNADGSYSPEFVITPEIAAQFSLNDDLIGTTQEADLGVFINAPEGKVQAA